MCCNSPERTRSAGVTDKFGVLRSFVDGEVTFRLEGPGKLVGDTPFHLVDSGGSGALLVRTLAVAQEEFVSPQHMPVSAKLMRNYMFGRPAPKLYLSLQLQTHPCKVRVIPTFEYLAVSASDK